MMKKHLMALATALLASPLFAFPTQLEVRKVAPVVESLIEGDLRAADAGASPRATVAEKIHGLVGDADTDAARWLLLRHAFVQYAKAPDHGRAAEVMAEILEAFPDIAPGTALALIDRNVRNLRRGESDELIALRDTLQMRKACAAVTANPKASQTRKAEALCLTGQWRKGLAAFARIKSDAGAFAERELKSEKPSMEAADFWWDYESPLDTCGAFRAHAVEIYGRVLDEDGVGGLRRKLAETRIAEHQARAALPASTSASASRRQGGLYMVIDLSGRRYRVSYLDAAPSKWRDEYKTRKIVLRRIDAAGGTYYAGVFEVTEAQWDRVMGGGSSNSTKAKAYASFNAIRGDSNAYDWPHTNKVDPDSFMGRLRERTGLETLDLPSEAEWEFAARAGVTTMWLCGDSADGLGDYAWYRANSGGQTHEVGTRKPNAWGIYDVHGNVWERCLNRYSSGRSSLVLRGGAYDCDASNCAFSFPYLHAPPNGTHFSGFRLFCRPSSK